MTMNNSETQRPAPENVLKPTVFIPERRGEEVVAVYKV
jgi:hypothetical protein